MPVMPSSPGSASGLRSAPCSTAPDRPSPPPTSAASSVRGRRICHRISGSGTPTNAVADQQRSGEQPSQQQREADRRSGRRPSELRRACPRRNPVGLCPNSRCLISLRPFRLCPDSPHPYSRCPASPGAHPASRSAARTVNGPAHTVSAGGSSLRGIRSSAAQPSASVASDGYVRGHGGHQQIGRVPQQRFQADTPAVRSVRKASFAQHRVHQRARPGGITARLPDQSAQAVPPGGVTRPAGRPWRRSAPHRVPARRAMRPAPGFACESRRNPAACRASSPAAPRAPAGRASSARRTRRPARGQAQPHHRLRRSADDRQAAGRPATNDSAGSRASGDSAATFSGASNTSIWSAHTFSETTR